MLELITRLLIDLSEQRLTAYASGPQPIYSALVSTGLSASPTPTGDFRIAAKYARTPLTGADYRTPAVPDVMCLGGGGLGADRFCIHPAPWQEDRGQCFGVARSRGCIRVSRATARWLFARTAVGTPVRIQP
ncbi:MAG: L,D-transpeptidase [Cyanobium sp. M30B3]|jgi:lipoprotein-anchoring transpeptidase ErfK/SrfK|nr:MAG: L,D-transpeptidase [Cyanobium sp. M30B3]